MIQARANPVSFHALAESLPRDCDWEALRDDLERRLDESRSGVGLMCLAERQLLAGLRLRERLLPIPYYARLDRRGPEWWIALKGSEGASLAE